MKNLLSLALVSLFCLSTSANEMRFLSLVGNEGTPSSTNDDGNTAISADNYLTALAPLQAPVQSKAVQAPLKAPLQSPKQAPVQAPSKVSLVKEHQCFVLFPARRAALQELRADRRLNRAGLVAERRVNDGGDVTVGESGQCSTCNVRSVGSRTVQENPGNQCNSGNGQCTGRRGLFRR